MTKLWINCAVFTNISLVNCARSAVDKAFILWETNCLTKSDMQNSVQLYLFFQIISY